ncbi:hypothetical protein CLAFUW4_11365 [Fulvia fulva]|uniref:Uncharacterized protein n=1 Tax=Passalora fulva TaxID=5499 RepID=A0A9Q8PCW8_PASFU|nr:uncharacterized protein CLAFUR5_10406 [Fulvia fulva]KAK4620119.1 hypothetical protein CLAFUR4_11371 [Fulvia fulva]KAK4620846.1 hypothetical protein CLAFUR0_11377 [Fulvia fulva]UJO20163.1 hypothetical protein CLAFUR5_10406 [Fulvia fulva]WPV17355.1 hypothetical protein CLAFUW4_11365 [Fulvia fulva]WPV32629.1 hypothetical protein CLAFUW7_11361 [Fulvia fulva]
MADIINPVPKPRPSRYTTTFFDFLSLPAELQLQIIELMVKEPKPINIDRDLTYRSATQPAITRVCGSIRADALPLHYRLNTFEGNYCSWSWLCERTMKCLSGIGAVNHGYLKGMVLCHTFPYTKRKDCLKAVEWALRKMEAEVVEGKHERVIVTFPKK